MKTAVKISAALVCAAMAACAAAEVEEVKEITAALKERLLPADEKFLSHDAILNEVAAADVAADNAWRSLKSREEYDAHRAKLHAKYVEAIGGLKFERTPLNAKVTEKIARSGYRIEKVIFESRPGVFVTGLLFLPD